MQKLYRLFIAIAVAIIASALLFISHDVHAVNYKEHWVILDDHETSLPANPGWGYNATGGDRGVLNVGPMAYSWDGDSAYTATTIFHPGDGWQWGGMWYSLIRPDNDNVGLNFSKIFGPYIKDQYQGEVTRVEIDVAAADVLTLYGASPILTVQLKRPDGSILYQQQFDLVSQTYPRTFVMDIPEATRDNEIEQIVWVFDKTHSGDAITIDAIRLKARVVELPAQEEAFLWSYSWLMANYNPATGMAQDRNNFQMNYFENVTATAKAAKLTYYAYRKGYIEYSDAVAIITKIADTLINTLPTGPAGINTLWPHFTKNGGTAVAETSEWASGDTAYAALDLIAALQMIGDPSNQLSSAEAFLENINWADLLSTDGRFISQGYDQTGALKLYYWDSFGMEAIGVNWVYESATGNFADMKPPPTYNGSGFIDNAHYPIVFMGVDRWNNDWSNYRDKMAERQINWYTDDNFNSYLSSAGLFGLSAAEVPDAYLEPVPNYIPYGVGGTVGPEDEGGTVVTLHYCGMIADIKPQAAQNMWETLRDRPPVYPFLQEKIILSPLNYMESMSVNKTTGKITLNRLKLSWNISLLADGWAMADPLVKSDLESAIMDNAFLKRGYDSLTSWIINMVEMPGWGMVSLPVAPESPVLSDIFPEAVVVYGFDGNAGYVRVQANEELEVGKGYWILLNEARTYALTGECIQEYPLSVEDGWYMIGGCTHPAQVVPYGCDIGVIYGFNQEVGYQRIPEPEILEPSKGYWILIKNATPEATISVETVN